MALGTILGSVAGGLASGAAGFGLSKLFGGNKNPTAGLQSFAPTGINAGGLTTSASGGNIAVTPSAERLGLVGNIAGGFGSLADELRQLRGKVAPGISELRANRLAEIEGARQRAIGDLRENLQRRRVLGSSFGNDAIARAESEFAGQRERVAAESTLQELEASNNLINQQFSAQRQQFQTFLDELNLEAGIATGIATKATETMGANARMLAQLNVLEAQSSGKFFGQMFGPATSAIGKTGGNFLSSLLGGGGGISTGTIAPGGGGIIGVGPFR